MWTCFNYARNKSGIYTKKIDPSLVQGLKVFRFVAMVHVSRTTYFRYKFSLQVRLLYSSAFHYK